MKIDALVKKIIGDIIIEEGRPYIILIGGGSCSGKTGLARRMSEEFLKREIKSLAIPMDDFYIGIREMEIKGLGENFDDISAVDIPSLRNTLINLRKGFRAVKPIYSFETSEREGYERIDPTDVIIVEGLYALHHWVKEFGNLRLFLDCDKETMLGRRLERDVKERGYDPKDIIKQFFDSVWPMYHEHILPTRSYANITGHISLQTYLQETVL